MSDQTLPKHLIALEEKCQEVGFTQPSDRAIGYLLRTLIASKSGGQFLELGTGIGLSFAWLVDGMDSKSSLVSLDNNEELTTIVKSFYPNNDHVTIHCTDGESWIDEHKDQQFDLIFADTWPGKYNHLDEVLNMVKVGGFYIIDDLDEQPNWPEGHAQKAANLINYLKGLPNFNFTHMAGWSTGVMIGVRTS
ncbi:O-methyltransferase [Marinoscillum pacificum]|uniref:O-methyltransferase n=1 Tax=Marinoscillum pacificum TaxID=392723 RepID=UPI0021585962|nr:class I SAM-dependent methyltransferase [Marinoscillum pacificum]